MTASSVLLALLLVTQAPVRPTEVDVPGLGVKIPVGWRLVLDRGCRFAVPLAWTVALDGAIATGPDGNVASFASIPAVTVSSYRNNLQRRVGRGVVVHQDDALRLWVEFVDESRHEHRVVAAGLAVACVATLDIREAPDAADLARIIAESVAPAPGQWPPFR
jgi:hypothetical protein